MTTSVEPLHPLTLTDARRYLNARQAPGRVVSLTHSVSTSGRAPLDVRGPNEGDPLVIYLLSGLPDLRFLSGQIVFVAGSSWGNACTIYPGAKVRIVVRSGYKMTVRLADGAKLPELDGDLTRCYWPGKYDDAPPLF